MKSDITLLVPESALLIDRQFEALDARAVEDLVAQGFAADEVQCRREADCRYAGQGFELRVPIDGAVTAESLSSITERFHDLHRKTYGHAATDERVEVVSCRVRALVEMPKYRPTPLAPFVGGPLAPLTRPIHQGGEWRDAAVLSRANLAVGATISGPAIIEQPDTTTLLPAGWTLRVDAYGNLDLGLDPA